MEKIIFFDISAVPLYALILSTSLYRKMTRGRSNRLYLAILAMAFLCTLSELLERCAYFYSYPLDEGGIVWVKITEYTYFAGRNLTNLLYIFYVFSTTRTWFRIRRLHKKLIIMMPFFASLAMLATNELTGWVFTVTPMEGYMRGSRIMIVYALAMTYMVFGTVYLIMQRRSLDMGSWFALMSMYLFNFLAVGIQFFFGNILIECFATSMTMLFVVTFIHRPEKQVDMSTGLPGYRAFCEELGKIKTTGQDVMLMLICISNATEMKGYLGDNEYYSYINMIEEQVRIFARKEKIVYELYFEHPGTFYILIDPEYNPVQAIPYIRESIREKGRDILQSGAKPDNRVVTIRFPGDISDTGELLRFGHRFLRFADPDKIYSKGENIVKQREYQIEAHIDEILARMAEKGNAQVAYRLLWSEEDKRYIAAEAVLKLSDEIYGEIETNLLMGAAEERGYNMRLENYLMEKVFEFAGSGRLKELKLSHVSLKLSVGHCMQMDLSDEIWGLREKYRVDPSQIEFQIKESVYENMSTVLDENLRKLSMQGYILALDGFGRGYTNLRHILTMPVSAVWLDESMIDAASSESGRAILKGSIQMLKEIPLKVVARGVDDADEVKVLNEAGCRYMQGTAFAGAVNENELKALIDNKRRTGETE